MSVFTREELNKPKEQDAISEDKFNFSILNIKYIEQFI